MSILYYLVSFFLIINIIVFIHEYGHYLAAKKCNVKISKFSIGIGPEIWGVDDKYGTRWCFSLLPIGGYVLMLGDGDIASTTENEESLKELSEEERQQSFPAKSNWEKMSIAFCGPLFNYIYAFIVMVLMSVFYGAPQYRPIVEEVLNGSPAEKCGIMPGDKILSVDGEKVEKYRDIVIKISDNKSEKIVFLIERKERQMVFRIAPEIKEVKKLIGGTRKSKIVGIKSGKPVFEKRFLWGALGYAFHECASTTAEMCGVFAKLFMGKKSIDDFGGVVHMASIAGDLSKTGNFALLIMFTVTLSLNLGFINLLPLPVLDGGRIFICLIEQIFGKKLNQTLQERIMIVCAFLLISLMLVTTVNDVLRIEVVSRFVSNLMR
jgi:regulator of sigma E protease